MVRRFCGLNAAVRGIFAGRGEGSQRVVEERRRMGQGFEKLERRLMLSVMGDMVTVEEPAESAPKGTIVSDASGNVFGVTNGSVLYEMSASTHAFEALTALHNGAHNGKADSGVSIDGSGNVYGFMEDMTTFQEMLYKWDASTQQLSTLLTATGEELGGLVLPVADANGDLFMTVGGEEGAWSGAIVKLPAGSQTVQTVYAFTGGSDGWMPKALTMDSHGNLFGTSLVGANTAVFELPAGATKVKMRGTIGGGKSGNIVVDGAGNIYGEFLSQTDIFNPFLYKISAGTSKVKIVAGVQGQARSDLQIAVDGEGNIYGAGQGDIFELAAGAKDVTYPLGGIGSIDSDFGAGIVIAPTGRIYASYYRESGLEGNVGVGFPGTHLVIEQQPTSGYVGVSPSTPLVVAVEDSNGNVVTDEFGTVTVFGALPHFPSYIWSGEMVNGVATVDLKGPSTGNYVLTVGKGGLADVLATPFVVTEGRHAVLTVPTEVVAGDAMTLTISMEDQNGNVVSMNGEVTIGVSSGPAGGGLSGNTTATLFDGTATVSGLSLSVAGEYTLSVDSFFGSSGTSGSVEVVAGEAAQLGFVGGPFFDTPGNNVILPVEVGLEDKYGNPVVEDDTGIVLTVSDGSGASVLTLTANAVDGVAVFSGIALTDVGSYSLSATDGDLSTVGAGVLTVAEPQLVFKEAMYRGEARQKIGEVIEVDIEDGAGQILLGDDSAVTIGIGTGPNVSKIAGTLTVNAVNGVALFGNVALSASGVYQLVAQAGAYTSGNTGAVMSLADIQAAGQMDLGDGRRISSDPTIDGAGNIYAVATEAGGNATIVEIEKATGNETTVAQLDGAIGTEDVSLAADTAGNLFGITDDGGVDGFGGMFEIAAGSQTVCVMGSFTTNMGSGPLFIDRNDNLFWSYVVVAGENRYENFIAEWASGAAQPKALFHGGASESFLIGKLALDDAGNIFLLRASSHGFTNVVELPHGGGSLRVLATASDATGAIRDIAEDGAGNVYGLMDTEVFEIRAGSSSSTVLAKFSVDDIGSFTSLAVGANGKVYLLGRFGPNAVGGIFEVLTKARLVEPVVVFDSGMGQKIQGNLISSSDGTLYGETTVSLGVGGSVYSVATGNALAPAVKIVFLVGPQNGTSDVVMSPITVVAEDEDGNIVRADSSLVTFTLTSSENNTIGSVTGQMGNGGVTWSALNVLYTGTYYLSVTDGDLPVVASQRFVISPNAARSKLDLGWQPNAGIMVGVPAQPAAVVRITDSEGNLVTTDHSVVTMTVVSGPSRVGTQLTATVHGGVATFSNITFLAGGTYHLELSDGALANPAVVDYTQVVNMGTSVTPVPRVASGGYAYAAGALQLRIGSNAPGSVPFGGTAELLDENEQVVATATVGSGGAVTLPLGTLAVGTHTLTAVYLGDAGRTASSSRAFSVTVNKAATTTVLGVTPGVIVAGQSVVLTATVGAGSSGADRTRSVTFMDGTAVVGVVTLSENGATLTVSSPTVGVHHYAAVYSGDMDFKASGTGGGKVTVNKDVVTALAVSGAAAGTVVVGETVTLSDTFVLRSPASGVPAGVATFKDAGKVIGTATLDGNGTATLTTAFATAGNHTITVSYGGSATAGTATSASFGQVVGKGLTSVVASGPMGTVAAGTKVTLNASVAVVLPGAGMATGTVQIKEGGKVLGTVMLKNGGAIWTSGSTTFKTGTHELVLLYLGDSNDVGSASTLLEFTVG